MQKVLTLFVIFSIFLPVYSAPINKAVYKSMTSGSYRSNYNHQINNKTVPYWQIQSNYATRNRFYQNYSNYNSSTIHNSNKSMQSGWSSR